MSEQSRPEREDLPPETGQTRETVTPGNVATSITRHGRAVNRSVFVIVALATIGAIMLLVGINPLANALLATTGAYVLVTAGIAWIILCVTLMIFMVRTWLERRTNGGHPPSRTPQLPDGTGEEKGHCK